MKCHWFDCNTRTRAVPVSIYWSVVKSVICETRRYGGLWHPTSSSCGGLRGPFRASDMLGEFILIINEKKFQENQLTFDLSMVLSKSDLRDTINPLLTGSESMCRSFMSSSIQNGLKSRFKNSAILMAKMAKKCLKLVMTIFGPQNPLFV